MSNAHSFDFEHWAELARKDPEAFEALRMEAINEVIEQAPPHIRQRLRGLQFKVDMERRRCRTPLAACIRLSGMMMDALYDQLLPALRQLDGSSPCAVPAAAIAVRDNIVQFPERRMTSA